MSLPTDNGNVGCISDEALQELAAASAELSEPAMQRHLGECADCRARLEHMKRETAALRALFSRSPQALHEVCPSDAELAIYLDHASGDDERDRMTGHVASCVSCRRRLVAIYREVKTVSSASDGADDVSTVVSVDTLRAGGKTIATQAEDATEETATKPLSDSAPADEVEAEARKKRYSSHSS